MNAGFRDRRDSGNPAEKISGPAPSVAARANAPRFDMTEASALLAPIAVIYHHRVKRYGADPKGVYWRHQFGQYLRFELLLGLIPKDRAARGGLVLNDLGCGYGAFFDVIRKRTFLRDGLYIGYDICETMVDMAGRRIRDPRARFVQSAVACFMADYSFVSGTYNMKLEADDDSWNAYVKESLRQLWSCSRSGLAFNMLDVSGKTEDTGLYYADAGEFTEFCRREMSPDVTLVDNSPLDEWTVLVRRQP